jgi:hypothetical protein
MTEYQIEFSIRRRQDGEEDFAEIGFAPTGIWESVNECGHDVLAMVQNRTWDSEQDIDPKDVD